MKWWDIPAISYPYKVLRDQILRHDFALPGVGVGNLIHYRLSCCNFVAPNVYTLLLCVTGDALYRDVSSEFPDKQILQLILIFLSDAIIEPTISSEKVIPENTYVDIGNITQASE